MSHKSSPFKTVKIETEKPTSPESLFRDLKKKDIQFLWSHQADILRDYQKMETVSDLTLELPTGAGKTLIGLLIGEYRRRKFDERILYLCPTRQLAFQVEKKATEYGIPAHALVGPQKEFSQAELSDYLFSKAIAITTYSGLFNANPRFSDPHVILLDDAHSAEAYISSHWTLVIDRHSDFEIYQSVVEILKGTLPEQYLQDMLTSDTRPSFVVRRDIDCVPMPLLYEKLDTLREYLDEKIEGDNRWSWGMIRDHLEACQIYVTWRAITIRPLIPPTFTHVPFSSARQRVYMSATLGEGGELERSLGLTQIKSLPIPAGWDRQTTGRRFVLFPNTSLLDDDIKTLICRSIGMQPRTLVLTPDTAQANEFEDLLSNCDPIPTIWKKSEVETSLDGFINSQNSLLLLTNRYDGIDLPDNDCRVEIIFGEPSATNPQERFFLSRLGAASLLKNRIRTRMAQALGRCVRNANDYALILMIGSDIANFCKEDNLLALHPEMQAELSFGLENSIGQSLDNFEAMIRIFLQQTDDWRSVESQIVTLRENKERKADASLIQLGKVANSEVIFFRSLWMMKYDDAQRYAQQVLDQLGGDELTAYRGWWYYLAGYVAWLRYMDNRDDMAFQLAQEHFERASRTSVSVSWLVYLKRLKKDATIQAIDSDFMLATVIENMYVEFSKIPLQGNRFEQRFNLFEHKINDNESHIFELALEDLGRLLGFSSESPGGNGAPDAIWYIADKYTIAFEAKSSQKTDGTIGKGDVQQANGHRNWIIANRPDATGEIICVILSHRNSLQADAIPHVEELRYLKINEIRALAGKVSSVYRKIRPFASTMAPEKVKEMLVCEVEDKDLSPETVVKKICGYYLKDLPVSEQK